MSFADEWNDLTERVGQHDKSIARLEERMDSRRVHEERLFKRVHELEMGRTATKPEPSTSAPFLLAAAQAVLDVWELPTMMQPTINVLRDAVNAEPARQAEHEAAVRELGELVRRHYCSAVIVKAVARVEATS